MNRTKLNRFTKLAIVAITLGISQQSIAGDWSLGVIAGQAKADGLSRECDALFSNDGRQAIETFFIDCSGDDTSSAAGINIAYNFNNNFGVEAGYVDLGKFDIATLNFSIGGPTIFTEELSIEAKIGYLAGTASYNLNDKWSVTGRLGAYNADAKFVDDFSSLDPDVNTDVYFGASVDYAFTDNWSAQVRYDNFDIDMTSVGLRYSFK